MGVYKVGDTWYYLLYHNGQRIRKAVGSQKSEANAALEAVKTDIRRGEYKFKRTARIKFRDFADEYLKYAKANKRSWARDESALEMHLKPFFKDLHISKIAPKKVEEYKQKRLDDHKLTHKNRKEEEKEKISPTTINRELALLKSMFSLAIKWNYLDKNPVKQIKFSRERQLDKVLDKDEIPRLLAEACDHLKPILILALTTGMRKGEILRLRWNDIDFVEDFIFIKDTKSGIPRKVPMSSLVRDALKRIKREGDFVFCNPETRGRIQDIKTAFNAACRRAKIKDFRFHDLRHTAATNMVMAGVDLVTVKEILGHSSIQTTMRYAHPTPENKRKAVEALAAVIQKKLIQTTIKQPHEKKESPITASLSDN